MPAFLASVLISKNPAHYGFDVVLEPPLEYETVRLDRPVDLEQPRRAEPTLPRRPPGAEPRAAIAGHAAPARGLRPQGPGRHRARRVLLAFAAAPTAKPPAFKTHVAKKGETLPRIASDYGVSVTALASANSLSTRSRRSRAARRSSFPQKVAAGRRRPADATKAKPASAEGKADDRPPRRPRKSYGSRAATRSTGSRIRHGVTVAEILAVNSLGGAARDQGRRQAHDPGQGAS